VRRRASVVASRLSEAAAFAARAFESGIKPGINLSESQDNSEPQEPLGKAETA
jgi:hypothetical protein